MISTAHCASLGSGIIIFSFCADMIPETSTLVSYTVFEGTGSPAKCYKEVGIIYHCDTFTTVKVL